MKSVLMSIAVLCLAAQLSAQSTIPADKDALLKGVEADQALVADANGFPSPKKAISMKDELGISKDQMRKIDDLANGVDISAKLKGEDIVTAETELNNMFEAGTATEKNVRAKLQEIGKLRAELRYMHIQSRLKMKQILSANQLARYKELQQNEAK